MIRNLTRLLHDLLKASLYSAAGAAVVLIIVFVLYLDGRADLAPWHLVELDEEFTADSNLAAFEDYLRLEDRLFAQLDDLVYSQMPVTEHKTINRYQRGSLADPAQWPTNWNRSFELVPDTPRAGVLLLHGMSDSPYSLRHFGQRLQGEGVHVLGLRMPGHGTLPSGLVELTWQDMAAAVRLAARHLAQQLDDRPLYVIGYSTGAALAVFYSLEALEDDSLPRFDRMVLLSPAIGVTSIAALAVWQARLGHLLGLDKLAWSDILPEYDAFKYGSFPVNAGDVVYRLTSEIQNRMTALHNQNRLTEMPPILAFSSVVDATVSTTALVKGLFERLPKGGHELVLFDINRRAGIEPILTAQPTGVLQALSENAHPSYRLSLVANEHPRSSKVQVRSMPEAGGEASVSDLGLSWRDDLYSLSHVSLPFPENDELYGGRPLGDNPLTLGDIALRGERGVLRVSASDMLRLRWNPFFPYVEARTLAFFGLSSRTHHRADPGG